MASPATKSARGLSRQSIHAASVTKIGARFASSVALAMLVSMIDQCQTARSPAKKKPAHTSSREGAGFCPSGSVRAQSAHSHSSGSASATRQKAVETGPVSLTFTKRADVAIAAAPASSEITAMRLARSAGTGELPSKQV